MIPLCSCFSTKKSQQKSSEESISSQPRMTASQQLRPIEPIRKSETNIRKSETGYVPGSFSLEEICRYCRAPGHDKFNCPKKQLNEKG